MSISKLLFCIRMCFKFLSSFVNVIYLNVASYLYGKQIKSKLGNKLYL